MRLLLKQRCLVFALSQKKFTEVTYSKRVKTGKQNRLSKSLRHIRQNTKPLSSFHPLVGWKEDEEGIPFWITYQNMQEFRPVVPKLFCSSSPPLIWSANPIHPPWKSWPGAGTELGLSTTVRSEASAAAGAVVGARSGAEWCSLPAPPGGWLGPCCVPS